MAASYPHVLDPSAYPDYTRRPVRVPTWETFGNRPQLTTLRVFSIRHGRLVNWREDLDLYTEELRLGRVIWPVFQTMLAENFKDLVQEAKRRGLFLFDFWGHVPGSGMEAMWSHVMPPKGMVEHMEQELGDHFLGIDNGEQDGRYVAGYAFQQCPVSADHVRQYINFHRHFEQMGNDLGNHLTTLVSLTFGHYFLKEGNHVLIGAETAQALPNSQVYYAFIRGAGKQHGVHWFGNASIWNRWGYKSYESEGIMEVGAGSGYRHGPEQGTSLSLLKRLLYTHYLYNSVAVGFEQSWIQGDNTEKRLEGLPVPMEEDRSTAVLTPVGKIQAAAGQFIERHGQPGTLHTPVALLLDFFAGWTVPRHLYTHHVFQVWGALPYGMGDYLTHGILSLLYPGYENASYYRDERGFLTATPYGDMADAILSDAPLSVLQQYGLIAAAGSLRVDRELQDKLQAYVAGGGELLMTAENAGHLVPGLVLDAVPQRLGSGAVVRWSDGAEDAETHSFDLCAAACPRDAEILATCNDRPAVIRIPSGAGSYTVLLSPHGLNAEALVRGALHVPDHVKDSFLVRSDPAAADATAAAVARQGEPLLNVDHAPLACPYTLLNHVRRTLGAALARQQLFTVSEGLGLATCRKGQGEYTLGVYNNDLQARPLRIESLCGPIRSLKELILDQSEKGSPGYWPTGFGKNDGGKSDSRWIAGGDIRLYAVSVEEKGVRSLPRVSPAPRPRNRMLALRGSESIQEQILTRPTFFQHFDGVKVDWTYFRQRDRSELERGAGWLTRQQVRVVADFSHGLNFYPDLTLLDTLAWRYEQSMKTIEETLDKMALTNAKDAVICLHRRPENHCDDQRANARFLAGVQELCRKAAARSVTVHLQHHPLKWYGTATRMLAFIAQVDAPNLRFALNVGHAALKREAVAEILAAAAKRLGLILLSAPSVDQLGQLYDSHAPIRGSGLNLAPLGVYSEVPQILDADYPDWSAEYLDCIAAWGEGDAGLPLIS